MPCRQKLGVFRLAVSCGAWTGHDHRVGCWQNGSKRPVLKHGPRSPTWMRVFGWQAHTRNESKSVGIARGTTGRSRGILSTVPSWSIHAGTRKMVNYAWVGRSHGKLWWRSVEVLTCNSIFKPGYRGERLIEPSSSWFLPKFPSE